jgi:hypothetical protein
MQNKVIQVGRYKPKFEHCKGGRGNVQRQRQQQTPLPSRHGVPLHSQIQKRVLITRQGFCQFDCPHITYLSCITPTHERFVITCISKTVLAWFPDKSSSVRLKLSSLPISVLVMKYTFQSQTS